MVRSFLERGLTLIIAAHKSNGIMGVAYPSDGFAVAFVIVIVNRSVPDRI